MSQEADPDAVRRALTNLIDNAIKYPSGEKEIAVELIKEGKQGEIRVSDKESRIPIKEKDFLKDFTGAKKRFATARKGSGPGLKAIKYVMDAHRGKIRAESQPGEGSTFRPIFPVP